MGGEVIFAAFAEFGTSISAVFSVRLTDKQIAGFSRKATRHAAEKRRNLQESQVQGAVAPCRVQGSALALLYWARLGISAGRGGR